MKFLLILGLCVLIIQESVGPPVTKEKKKEQEKHSSEYEEPAFNPEDHLEYKRYLREVVDVLEQDPKFIAKLRNANEETIKSGKIAHELEFMNTTLRTQLDEIKRREIDRLKHLIEKEMEIEKGMDRKHLKISEHLNHNNSHSFEIDDLKKLIAKTTEDLHEIDKKRRLRFKEYEMQKKYNQEETMKSMDEEHKKKFEEELHKMQEEHKKHEPLHHPGSKQQLEEVWEKQDHMNDVKFDPKTFFVMHDIDGNNFWDQNEVNALFRIELDKLYAQGHPEDDLLERAEEMERMREHLIGEADLNQDGFISYDEFWKITNKPAFQKDEGWETLDEEQVYTNEEYAEYEKHKRNEITKGQPSTQPPVNTHPNQQQYAQHQGMPNQQVPYHGQPMQVQYQQPPPYQGQVPPHQMQGQMPQQYQQVPPQYQVPLNQIPQNGYVQQQYQGQVPPQQYQGQPSQQQYQGLPPQQQYQGQPPQQQYQGQPPQQQYQGQPPQQQYQGQPPQQQYQGQPPQQQGQVPQPQQGQVAQPQQGQVPQPQQGQVPQQQQQVPVQVNQPPQGQQVQQNPPVAQATGNVPVPNSIPDAKKV